MSENNSVTQSGRDPKTGQFLQGISGNPAGRSSRNKLSEQFISDFYDEWQKSGANVLKTVAETDPVAFMRCVASILPKEIDATLSVHVDLFRECTTFMQAYRIARQAIGVDEDDTPLIEAEDEA